MPHHRSLRSIVLSSILSLVSGCATTPRAEQEAKRPPAKSLDIPRPDLRLTAFDAAQTTLAVYRFVRQISMIYRLDLQKNNAHAAAMAEILRDHDNKVRGCYTARLGLEPHLKGRLALSFELSKETGTMRNIVRTGGTLADRALVSCISKELARLPFNPPITMQGNMIYSFKVTESAPAAR